MFTSSDVCVRACMCNKMYSGSPNGLTGQAGGCSGPWENCSGKQVNMSPRLFGVSSFVAAPMCPIFPPRSCQSTAGQKLISTFIFENRPILVFTGDIIMTNLYNLMSEHLINYVNWQRSKHIFIIQMTKVSVLSPIMMFMDMMALETNKRGEGV